MDISTIIRDKFPEINEPALVKAIEDLGSLMEVPAGERIVEVGNYVRFMPLVVEGAIKVMREDDEGGEIFLYYLLPGQTCAMTLNCCSANLPSEITAVAVEDTIMIALPIEVMDDWLRSHRPWQNFVLNTYSYRFNELLNTIDSVAFLQLDERLLKYLKDKATLSGSYEIKTTHQQIALDLNSSREVISRLLKQLEKKGMIEIGRNKIFLRRED